MKQRNMNINQMNNMKKSGFLSIILGLLVLSFWGCKENKSTRDEAKVIGGIMEENVLDTTIYGRCLDGAMSSLIILSEAGDTMEFVLETMDDMADVQGGVFIGDKMAIISEEVDGELFAKKVINVTSLLGKWRSLDRDFDIKDNGVVESHLTTESHPYTSWSILNGQLILSSDTFDILSLGHDSLSLENRKGIYVYKRQK